MYYRGSNRTRIGRVLFCLTEVCGSCSAGLLLILRGSAWSTYARKELSLHRNMTAEPRKNKEGGSALLFSDSNTGGQRSALKRNTCNTHGRKKSTGVGCTSGGRSSGSEKSSKFPQGHLRGSRSKRRDSQLRKKKSNKKLPTEVSSRRPHRVATLPPLPFHALAQKREEEDDADAEDEAGDCEDEDESADEKSGVDENSGGVLSNAEGCQRQPGAGAPSPSDGFVAHGRVSSLPPKFLKKKEALMRVHLKRLVTLNSQQRRRQGQGLVGQHGRDPRFLNACGPLDVRMVSKAYSFLDDMRREEAEALKAMIKTGKGSGYRRDSGLHPDGQKKKRKKLGAAEREQARKELQRLQSQEQTRKRRKAELDVRQRLAKQEIEKISRTGKAPYFLKKVDFKKLVSEELHAKAGMGAKKKAKLEERKTKKILAKEKKRALLPVRRRLTTAE